MRASTGHRLHGTCDLPAKFGASRSMMDAGRSTTNAQGQARSVGNHGRRDASPSSQSAQASPDCRAIQYEPPGHAPNRHRTDANTTVEVEPSFRPRSLRSPFPTVGGRKRTGPWSDPPQFALLHQVILLEFENPQPLGSGPEHEVRLAIDRLRSGSRCRRGDFRRRNVGRRRRRPRRLRARAAQQQSRKRPIHARLLHGAPLTSPPSEGQSCRACSPPT